jgi:hypothetical protein
MKNGFVKIPRHFFETPFWNEKRKFSKTDALLDILQHTDYKHGVLRSSYRALADRWQWNLPAVQRYVKSIVKEGFVFVISDTGGITFKNKYDTPNDTLSDTPNDTPKHPKTKASPNVCDTLSDTPNDTLSDTPRAYKNDILFNHSIEEEKKEERENNGLSTIIKEASLLAEVMQFFNKKVEKSLIPQIKSITGKRKSMLLARIREFGVENVYKAFEKAAASNFLNGGGNKGFVADFTWIVRPNNFPKVLEGNYDNRAYEPFRGLPEGVVLRKQDYSRKHF